MTITESKKRFDQNGEKAFYEKHKIFLYKEDFDKFMEGLTEAVEHIKVNRPDMPTYNREGDKGGERHEKKSLDFDFDDLGKKEE